MPNPINIILDYQSNQKYVLFNGLRGVRLSISTFWAPPTYRNPARLAIDLLNEQLPVFRYKIIISLYAQHLFLRNSYYSSINYSCISTLVTYSKITIYPYSPPD